MTMYFPNRHPRKNKVGPYFKKVAEIGGIGDLQPCVYLESVDYSGDTTVREDFLKSALFWHIGKQKNGSPPKVKVVMDDPKCNFLIWISKKVLDDGIDHIVWVYAHEYRHFMHKNGLGNIKSLSDHLKSIHDSEKVTKKYANLDIPQELECELFAKKIFMEIFGEHSLNRYIKRRSSFSGGVEYYQRFEYLENIICNEKGFLI